MSTEFAEVHMLDTRYYTASSIAQYAAWNHPDAVIIMSQTVAGTFYIKFGEDQQASWETDYPDEMVLLSDHSMTSYLLAGDLSSRIVPVSLESGQVYHLSFDHVSVSDENTACLSAVLFEKTQNRTVWAQVFDVDYGNAYHSFEWSFSVPAENAENRQYVLLLSPGVWKNSEANLSAVISGITLRKEI